MRGGLNRVWPPGHEKTDPVGQGSKRIDSGVGYVSIRGNKRGDLNRVWPPGGPEETKEESDTSLDDPAKDVLDRHNLTAFINSVPDESEDELDLKKLIVKNGWDPLTNLTQKMDRVTAQNAALMTVQEITAKLSAEVQNLRRALKVEKDLHTGSKTDAESVFERISGKLLASVGYLEKLVKVIKATSTMAIINSDSVIDAEQKVITYAKLARLRSQENIEEIVANANRTIPSPSLIITELEGGSHALFLSDIGKTDEEILECLLNSESQMNSIR